MKTCSTCKHWTEGDLEWDGRCRPMDPDTYEEMVMPFEVRYCHSPKLMRFERPLEADMASAVDGSEYMAEPLTGPDFGCVNHEPTPSL